MQGVEGQSTSLIAFDCNILFSPILLSILPLTASPTPSLYRLLVVSPLYPAPFRSVSPYLSSKSKQSESKPPTSSNSHPEDSCFQNSSHSISGSSQQRSSAAKMSAILRAIVVLSHADYGMQDQKPLLPLHGARRAFF